MGMEQKKQRIQRLIDMGERVHLLARLGHITDPELMTLSRKVMDLDRVINAHMGKQPPQKESGLCPQCGAAFEGTFCGSCGLNIEEFYSKPFMVCHVCTSLIVEAEDLFCGVCGSQREV